MIVLKPQKLDNHTIIKLLLLFDFLKSRGGRVKTLSTFPYIPVLYILIPKKGHQLRHQCERFTLSI